MSRKERLDQLLVDLALAPDLETARRIIMAGEVRTGDQVWDKPGQLLLKDTPLTIKPAACPFVSIGGLKLAKAFDALAFSPAGLECLDVGASTGGFTDVLLQRGAAKVTALDVGFGLLDWKLRKDDRVTVIEKTNFRLVQHDFFQQRFDAIVIDVSFISLVLVLPNAIHFLKPGGHIFALIKPQFEAEAGQVEKGGIVRDLAAQKQVFHKIESFMNERTFFLHGAEPVSSGKKKNPELVTWWRSSPSPFSTEAHDQLLERLIIP